MREEEGELAPSFVLYSFYSFMNPTPYSVVGSPVHFRCGLLKIDLGPDSSATNSRIWGRDTHDEAFVSGSCLISTSYTLHIREFNC